MAFWKAKIANGVRVYFKVVRQGILATGLSSGVFTVLIINPADSANQSLTVAESVQQVGMYYVDIPSGFLTTHGAGHYGLSVGIHSSSPAIDHEVLFPIEVTARDLDDLSFHSSSDVASDVWDELLTGATHNVATSAGRRLRQLTDLIVVSDGTAQTGTINSITLSATESSTDRIFDTNLITISNGTGVGQSRQILAYDGSSKIARVGRNWEVIPDNTSEYLIESESSDLFMSNGLAQSGTASTITLRPGAPSTDDLFAGEIIALQSGTGAGQARRVIQYDDTTKIANVEPDWNVIPDSTTVYAIIPSGRTDPADDSITSNTIAVSAVNEIVDAVWAKALETGFSADRILRIVAAAVAGKVSGGPTNPVFRNLGDTDDLITGTADSSGNRTDASYGS